MMPDLSTHTARFGGVEVVGAASLDFPEGLIGFHDYHRFVLLEPTVGGSPFRCMVSLDHEDVGFAIADPSRLFSDYEVDYANELEVLDIQGEEELVLYVILTIPEQPIRTTADLLAPLLVNTRTRIARQLVFSDSRYSTRHPIIAPRPAT